jgi:hypothetical protein
MFTGKNEHREIQSTLDPINFDKVKSLGLNIVDLSKIFINDHREIYTDGYCHLNDLGKKSLLEAMQPYVLDLLEEKKENQNMYCDAIGLRPYLQEL